MQTAAENDSGHSGPRQPGKHVSHNENVDEPAKLIDAEAVEIEREAPSEGNDPVEQVDNRKPPPPAFEE